MNPRPAFNSSAADRPEEAGLGLCYKIYSIFLLEMTYRQTLRSVSKWFHLKLNEK